MIQGDFGVFVTRQALGALVAGGTSLRSRDASYVTSAMRSRDFTPTDSAEEPFFRGGLSSVIGSDFEAELREGDAERAHLMTERVPCEYSFGDPSGPRRPWRRRGVRANSVTKR